MCGWQWSGCSIIMPYSWPLCDLQVTLQSALQVPGNAVFSRIQPLFPSEKDRLMSFQCLFFNPAVVGIQGKISTDAIINLSVHWQFPLPLCSIFQVPCISENKNKSPILLQTKFTLRKKKTKQNKNFLCFFIAHNSGTFQTVLWVTSVFSLGSIDKNNLTGCVKLQNPGWGVVRLNF